MKAKQFFYLLGVFLVFFTACGEHTSTMDGEKMKHQKQDSTRTVTDSSKHR